MPSAQSFSRLVHTPDLRALGASLAARYDMLVGEGIPAHLAMRVRQLQVQEPKIAPLPSCCALIVETDRHVRVLAELLLDELMVVVGCESAEAALQVMRARGQDVAFVLADLRLAGAMTGLDLAHAIVADWPATRMMLTSGSENGPGVNLPATVKFLPKPWGCAELLAEARAAIRKP